jgi:GNAT superfamily N-acetyltransferase
MAPAMPAYSFHVRPAERADLAAIVALVRALASYEKLTPPDDAAAERLGADVFGDPARVDVLVAEHEGELVGYAAHFMMYSTFVGRPSLYLEDLFVRPEARGHGIGGALLRHLARIAVTRGCGRFDWTVLDWNLEAQAFYRSLGAEIMPGFWTCRLQGAALDALAADAVRQEAHD